MWCPNCSAKYRDGFTRCADCKVDLVAKQPTEPPPIEYEKPVVVFTSSNIHEAHLVAGLLESNGINVRVFEGHLSSIQPFLINAVGGIKIVVDEKQADDAKNVLSEYRGKQGQSPSTGEVTPFGFINDAKSKTKSKKEKPAKSLTCSKCQNANETDAIFCDRCGEELTS